ncbi:MAG: FkbM family methyltransferase [Betaproteobacteria bacterium]
MRLSQRSPRTFIDGGACHGDFTELLLGEFADASIHAFEPNHELSVRLVQRFQNVPRVHVWNLALDERPGPAELHLHADPGTSSLLPRSLGARRYYHSSDRVVATVPVAATALDAFIDLYAPGGIGLLKLDTQGSELSILRGARRALETASIEVIYAEFFVVPHYAGAPLLGDLIALLGQFDYSLFDLFKGPYADNGQLRFGDAIFISPLFRARHIDTSPGEP